MLSPLLVSIVRIAGAGEMSRAALFPISFYSWFGYFLPGKSAANSAKLIRERREGAKEWVRERERERGQVLLLYVCDPCGWLLAFWSECTFFRCSKRHSAALTLIEVRVGLACVEIAPCAACKLRKMVFSDSRLIQKIIMLWRISFAKICF